jgi:hypothetical protein
VVDPAPAILRVKALLDSLGGIRTYIGVPESLAAAVNAYVALGRWATSHPQGLRLQHDLDIGVTFGYRVQGAEAGVEVAMATKIGAFIAAYLPDMLGATVGGLVNTGAAAEAKRPDFAVNGEPEYAQIAGQEYRLFRGRVPIVLYENFG